jgi:hypothetical protein
MNNNLEIKKKIRAEVVKNLQDKKFMKKIQTEYYNKKIVMQKCDFCFNLTLSEIKKDHLCKTLISDGNTRTFCNCYCNAKRSNI